MTGARMGTQGWLLYGERLVVTVGLATVSYKIVEMPIRRGWLPNWRALVAVPVGAGLALGLVLVSTLVPVATTATAGDRLSSLATPARGPGAGAGAAAGGTAAGGGTATASGGIPSGASNVADFPAGSHPIKVLLVGDSIGGSLGVGLGAAGARYDIELVNEGSPGCSVSMDQLFRVLAYTVPPGTPCKDGDPAVLLDQWRSWVDAYNPDVVVYVARGELFDQQVSGQWSNVGQPGFDTSCRRALRAGDRRPGQPRAAVVLCTSPYYDSGLQPSGQPWPEDDATRVAADDSVMRQAVAAVAARRAGADGAAPDVRLDHLLHAGPPARFSQDVDGVEMRCGDGVHFTAAGGEWVATHCCPSWPSWAGATRSRHRRAPGLVRHHRPCPAGGRSSRAG